MKYQKRNVKNSDSDGIQTHDKIFSSFRHIKEESLRNIKEESLRNIKEERLQHSGFYGTRTHNLQQETPLLQISKKRFTNSGFDGIQTHDKIFSSFWNTKNESL